MIWTATEMIKATGGTMKGASDWNATGLALDNRKTEKGDVFIAIQGENHDGHDFVDGAYENGAVAALVSHEVPSDIPQIIVNDSLQALRQMAEAARRRCSAPIVAITGSVGKTGTKHIVSSCLAALGKTHASQGNYNNHIGAPLSLALMPRDAEFGVFELGMNHSGEIAALSPMVAPDLAIITRISNSHGGFFDSLDDIAAAKAEIFTGLANNGTAILNADDPYLDYLSGEARSHGASRIITCGTAEGADARLMDVTRHEHGLEVSAVINGQAIEFNMKMNASHWALSAIMALAVVSTLYPDNPEALKKAAQALQSLEDLDGRGKRHHATLSDGGVITLIDDSYNASPASMTSALLGLKEDPTPGRRVAILADMLELGDAADDLHRGLVDALAHAAPSVLICFGASMAHLAKAYEDQAPDCAIKHCASAKDAAVVAKSMLTNGDLVLVKGSNGMKTSHVVSALRAGSSPEAHTPKDNNKRGHHAA